MYDRVLVFPTITILLAALPKDGICDTTTGSGTMRAAIMESNACVDANTIILPVGTYLLTIPGYELGKGRGVGHCFT